MNETWTQRLAAACAQHRWRALGAWVVLLVAALAASAGLLGSAITTDATVTARPDSIKGFDLLEARFDERDAATELVVVRSGTATVDDPSVAELVGRLREDVAAIDAVEAVADPLAPQARGLVSSDRQAVLIPVTLADPDVADPAVDVVDVIELVRRADAEPGIDAAITGTWTLNHDFLEISERDLQRGELQFGLPAALVVLLLVFGAVVAAALPLLIAVVSIVVALGISAVVGQAFELSFFIVNMVVAMGLALGIDYTLFVASRYREERHRGLPKLAAIAVSGATASKAAFFSGMSFVVALLGLLLVPDTVLRSLAFGAVVVGLVTVAAALTLLPALLSLLGDRIERGRLPLLPAQHGGESRWWHAVVTAVTRRPGLTLTVTVLALLAATAPVLGLKTGSSGITALPDGALARQGFVALEQSFPAGARTDPAQVVVDADADAPPVAEAVGRLQSLVGEDGAYGPSTVSVNSAGDLTLVEIALEGDTAGSEARAAVERLRAEHVPDAFAGVDADVFVTGQTAFNLDYANLIDTWLPVVLAFVLGLSFLLLLLVFRSVVLPLKAVVLNLLSVGAAYGLLVLVFQYGVGAELLGLSEIERVEPWVPVFLFSVLFALSMDYHVFLLSRIRERYLATGDTVEAVVHGVGATGRIITGAALIIVVVFAGFATADIVGFQQMGFGVAVALLIDATVIRTLLVPSSMALLGRWNWYLPSWLSWLPEMHVEGGRESDAGALGVPAQARAPETETAPAGEPRRRRPSKSG